VVWCPGIAARNWQNDAYSPRTGLVYTSTLTNCRSQVVFEGQYVPGEGYTLQRQAGAVPRQLRLPDGTVPPPASGQGTPVTHMGELQANHPVEGRTVWRVINQNDDNNVPILATAGDLLFRASNERGEFQALNATNGEIVWTFRTGARNRGTPISYIWPDDRQYIAVINSSAPSNVQVALDANPDNANRYRRSGSTLYVYALPQTVAGQ
jgi:lanthanide-dependent methanol dehydrogenase